MHMRSGLDLRHWSSQHTTAYVAALRMYSHIGCDLPNHLSSTLSRLHPVQQYLPRINSSNMPHNLRHPLEAPNTPWPAPSEQPTPPTELISPSRSGSVDSCAPPSDLPTPSDPASSFGKRALDTGQLHPQTSPVKKKRLTESQRLATIADAVATIINCLDDDAEREGLRKTPVRYAKVFLSCLYIRLVVLSYIRCSTLHV